jgi:hypothetical protein
MVRFSLDSRHGESQCSKQLEFWRLKFPVSPSTIFGRTLKIAATLAHIKGLLDTLRRYVHCLPFISDHGAASVHAYKHFIVDHRKVDRAPVLFYLLFITNIAYSYRVTKRTFTGQAAMRRNRCVALISFSFHSNTITTMDRSWNQQTCSIWRLHSPILTILNIADFIVLSVLRKYRFCIS